MRPVGWRYDSARHALAAKGVRTYSVSKEEAKRLTLYHGTPERNVSGIRAEGLKGQHGEVWGTTDVETARQFAQEIKRFTRDDERILEEYAKDPEFVKEYMRARGMPVDDTEYVKQVTARLAQTRPDFVDTRASKDAIMKISGKYPRLNDIQGLKEKTGALVKFTTDVDKIQMDPDLIPLSDSFSVKSPVKNVTVVPKEEMLRKFNKPYRREEAQYGVPEGWFAKKVDLKRYAGLWRQERVKNEPWFQRGCKNVTARYSLNRDGTVKVVNTCDGRRVEGTAVSASKDNRKLKVDFGFPFKKGDYIIKSVNKEYTRAVVKSGDTEWTLVKA